MAGPESIPRSLSGKRFTVIQSRKYVTDRNELEQEPELAFAHDLLLYLNNKNIKPNEGFGGAWPDAEVAALIDIHTHEGYQQRYQIEEGEDTPESKLKHTKHATKKRQRRRDLDRNTAERFRENQKRRENDLNARAQMLQIDNSYLKDISMTLRHEIINLKTECLKHIDCDNGGIRRYLSLHVDAGTDAAGPNAGGDLYTSKVYRAAGWDLSPALDQHEHGAANDHTLPVEVPSKVFSH